MNAVRSARVGDMAGIYLREIAKVPLLAPHQEIWLSVQQKAASRIEAVRPQLGEQEGHPLTASETLDAILNALCQAWSSVSQSSRAKPQPGSPPAVQADLAGEALHSF
jgi:hypothetical protein